MMNKVKVALIGAGAWGSNYARVLPKLSQVELVAIADMKEDLVNKLLKEVNTKEVNTKAYTDYQKMLDQESLDAVFVTTPDWAHLEPSLSTIKKGLHLFVEKPIATTVEDGEKIIKAAKDKGVKLMVGQSYRFDTRFYLVYRAVKEGRIGEIIHIFGRSSDMQQSPIRYAGKTNPVYFLGIHYLDYIRWIAGDVKRIYSESTKILWKDLPTEDGFSTVMKLKSGASALLEFFWVLPTTRGKSAGRLEILGTKGAIFLDDYDRKVEIYDSNGVEYPDTIAKPTVFGRMVGTLNQEVSSFIECIINDTTPLVTGEDGLEALKLCIAICESAEKGKVITLN